jgi:hypothetical protein
LPIQQFIDEHNNEDIEMHCVEWNCKNLLAILLSSEYDYVSTENICRGLIIQAYDIQWRTSMICRHSWESISCTKSGDNPPSCASAN